tara:strand:+ start:338 stop:610 length:273 start_codon:yes stop_codon:yes gene_type:complete
MKVNPTFKSPMSVGMTSAPPLFVEDTFCIVNKKLKKIPWAIGVGVSLKSNVATEFKTVVDKLRGSISYDPVVPVGRGKETPPVSCDCGST